MTNKSVKVWCAPRQNAQQRAAICNAQQRRDTREARPGRFHRAGGNRAGGVARDIFLQVPNVLAAQHVQCAGGAARFEGADVGVEFLGLKLRLVFLIAVLKIGIDQDFQDVGLCQ